MLSRFQLQQPTPRRVRDLVGSRGLVGSRQAKPASYVLLLTISLAISCLGIGPSVANAQEAEPQTEAEKEAPKAPEKVDVEPVAEDVQISERLLSILKATDWFESPGVGVEEGVVFLSGKAGKKDQKQWASDLATSTQDVVAVVNQMTVQTPSLLDFSPAWAQLREMARITIQSTPTAAVSLLLLVLAYFAAKLTSRISRHLSDQRVDNSLLKGVISKAVALPVLLLGIYFALYISGLTRLAATVLGGTGLLGIVVGIAFRDIAENFLASILISVQRPFRVGDLVTIDNRQGFVQAITTRGTQLMTLNGNHVQVPNSMVYKSVIENATANPNLRLDFVVGIDYEDCAEDAQRVVFEALKSHEAVLPDPEPLVLVDELASSTINLKILFWIDSQQYSGLRARSAVIRLVKNALQQGGFTMPDESREIIFPRGVPVRMVDDLPGHGNKPPTTVGSQNASGKSLSGNRLASNQMVGDSLETETEKAAEADRQQASNQAEGGLQSERREIEEQAAKSRPLGSEQEIVTDETSAG